MIAMTVMTATLSWEQPSESSPLRKFKFTVPKCVSVTQGIWGRALAKSFLFSSKGKEPRAADTRFSPFLPLCLPNSQHLADQPWTDRGGFSQIKTLFSTPSSLQVGLVTHLEGSLPPPTHPDADPSHTSTWRRCLLNRLPTKLSEPIVYDQKLGIQWWRGWTTAECVLWI